VAGPLRSGAASRRSEVLIHAAAGGVGNFAVQWRRQKAPTSLELPRPRTKLFWANWVSTTQLITRRRDLKTWYMIADVVLDTIGGDTQERSFKALKKGGILVSLVSPLRKNRPLNMAFAPFSMAVMPAHPTSLKSQS